MIDAVLTWLQGAMGSPWIYPVLFALCCVDAVIPVFPSEAPLIMAGVYAGSTGSPNLLLVLLVAFAGALVGDHLTYFIGRQFAASLEKLPPESRRGKAMRGATTMLDRRGGTALVVARFIPWGRIATTLTFGAMRYSRPRFTMWDSLGVAIWALHGTLMGYIGGAAFEHQPLKGLALGLGLALVVSALIEAGRVLVSRARRSSARPAATAEDSPAGVAERS